MELLDGYPLQRRINIFGAGGIAVDKTSFFTKNLTAVLSPCSEVAVLALGRDIVSEVFLFCHSNIPFLQNNSLLSLYHISLFFSIEIFDNNKIVIINKNRTGISEF